MAYSRRDIAKAPDNATVTTSSAVVVGGWGSRVTLILKNVDATNAISLAFQSAVTPNGAAIAKGDSTTTQRPVAVANKGVVLAPGESFTTNDFSGAVAAIAAAGTPILAIQEF